MTARVLLVGSTDEQLAELNTGLKEAGFLTETATDVKECLEVGFWFQPHLVVTEVELSGFSGFDLSLFICSGQAGFSAKVIFYARAYRDEESRQATSRKYGAQGYFVKQFHKHALLKTAIEILTSVNLEGGAKVVLPPFPRAGQDRTKSHIWPSKRLDAAISGNYALVVTSQKQVAPGEVQDTDSEGQRAEAEPHLAGIAAQVGEEICSSTSSEQEGQPDSKLETKPLLLPASPDIEIQSQSPATNELSEVPTPEIPAEHKDSVVSKQLLSREAKILFAAAVAVLAVGLSISFWLSRLSIHGISPESSGATPPAKNQPSSLNQAFPEASTRADLAPAEPHAPATEALIRLLSSSVGSAGNATQRQTARAVSNSTPELVISDISATDRQQFSSTMIRPSLTPRQIRAMGSGSYVVSLDLDENGGVTSVRLLTSNTDGVLPEQVLDTVRQWRFVPRDKSQRGSSVKHFSFKSKPPAR